MEHNERQRQKYQPDIRGIHSLQKQINFCMKSYIKHINQKPNLNHFGRNEKDMDDSSITVSLTDAVVR